ncbi:MAG: penicillin-binding transpeptidase domain-containing protein, partial [Coriobacteriia bacterium]|nr:penicillin-binding transpeptidase domain-containing protein [Coriobacteriia bacterium]
RKTKPEILELYLNAIYFGEGAYGAQAASHVYFSKNADELTLSEAALLAALPQQPSRLSPYDNPDGALIRRNEVLDHMLDQGKITQAARDEAVAAPIELKRANEPNEGIFKTPYFVAHVKKVLQRKFDQATVFQGGLTVHTTIDLKRQKMAEDAVKSQLGKKSDPDVALVSIDPRNGHIVALVGGRDYDENKFNLATQGKRQPGSAFKTFVLVAALKEGMPPYRYVDSSSPAKIPSNPVWMVGNSEGSGKGRITLESGTRSSVNTVFARLIWELNDKDSTGAEKVAETAHDMGITSELPPYPSIALGAQNVTPLEMASAYGTLATNGKYVPATAITKVVDSSGKTIYKADDEPEQVLKPEIAYAATSILKGVITGGTARRAQIGRPAAGKTGTSQNYRDAWFVGYTPQLVTSVWVGYYKTEKSMRYVNGVRGFGGTLAAPIWAKYMSAALKDEPKLDFPKQKKPKYTWKSDWDRNQEIEVPGVVGMTLAEAKSLLDEADLKLSSKTGYSNTVPKGKIISQSPKAGSKAMQGSTVKVIVSGGKKPAAPPPSKPPTPTPEPTSTP